jgi:hypothetical protein
MTRMIRTCIMGTLIARRATATASVHHVRRSIGSRQANGCAKPGAVGHAGKQKPPPKPTADGCGRPRATRRVLSFSLRSPLTEPPSVIDVACWHETEVPTGSEHVRSSGGGRHRDWRRRLPPFARAMTATRSAPRRFHRPSNLPDDRQITDPALLAKRDDVTDQNGTEARAR